MSTTIGSKSRVRAPKQASQAASTHTEDWEHLRSAILARSGEAGFQAAHSFFRETAAVNGESLIFTALARAYELPQAASIGSEAEWREIAEQLHAIALEASAIKLEDDRIAWFAARIEIPLVLSSTLADLPEFRDLAPSVELSLERFREAILPEGTPAGRYLPELHALLASWTRCRMIAPDHAGFAAPFDSLVKTALHWSGFSMGPPSLRNAAWFTSTLELTNDPECLRLAQSLGLAAAGKARLTKLKKGTPELSAQHHVESAGLSLLRTDFKPQAARVAVTFDRPALEIELAQERPFVAGAWMVEIECEGRVFKPCDSWDETCRHDDEEAAYLELETELAEGIRLQRQILLARKEGFMFLADALLTPEAKPWRYRGTLPLAGELKIEPSEETHELRLIDKHRSRLVLPLALPEWRRDMPCGSLSVRDNHLTYEVVGRGSNLYAPLWFDCGSQRRPVEVTWRRLTVGERLEIVPRDRAAAFRVQVEKRQSVFYRALAERGNRTFLGKNTASEFYAGRFMKNGAIETIMEVE